MNPPLSSPDPDADPEGGSLSLALIGLSLKSFPAEVEMVMVVV